MNIKQIEQQIEKLNAKKLTAEEKKKQLIEKCDKEIADINSQIASFKKVRDQIEKLNKQQQEQMELASRLLSGE